MDRLYTVRAWPHLTPQEMSLTLQRIFENADGEVIGRESDDRTGNFADWAGVFDVFGSLSPLLSPGSHGRPFRQLLPGVARRFATQVGGTDCHRMRHGGAHAASVSRVV